MKSWYVIQTKPKKEDEANKYLSAKGLEVYTPLLETYSPKDGKLDKGCKPLFTGYIFSNFELPSDYSLVNWARGVKKIVGFGGNPTPIAEEVILEIRNRSDRDGIVKINREFIPEERIRVKAGPFKDFMGIFETWVPEKERVRILLNLIGYQPQVELHFSMIEKLN